ncbi:MAG: hypothetical protein ABI548_20730 [Polyangiaceae bacterium]
MSSLDAPTVAGTWCIAFLQASGAPHEAARWAALFLMLATWLCYVGDRVLDARATHPGVRTRHRFYGALWNTQRVALVTVVSAAALGCAATAWFGLSGSLLRGYLLLTAVSLAYFAWVHGGAERHARVLAKEAAVGVIFSIGCALPAWDAAASAARAQLVPTAGLFAVACWLNCVAIERWEGRGSIPAQAHWSTQWAARHLAMLLCSAALAAVALVLLGYDRHSNVPLASCLAVAFVLLAVLEWVHARLSAGALRILADVALLTPLAWWLVPRLLR